MGAPASDYTAKVDINNLAQRFAVGTLTRDTIVALYSEDVAVQVEEASKAYIVAEDTKGE